MTVPDPLCPPCEIRRSRLCEGVCEHLAHDLLTDEFVPCRCDCQRTAARRPS